MKAKDIIVWFMFFLFFVMYAWPITHTPIVLTVAVGRSMLPTLGELSFVVAVRPSVVSVGDIVLYHSPQFGNVIHRVIQIFDDNFVVVKGDNNYGPDPPITKDTIEYKVVFAVNPPLSYAIVLAYTAFMTGVPSYYLFSRAYPILKKHFEKETRYRTVFESSTR